MLGFRWVRPSESGDGECISIIVILESPTYDSDAKVGCTLTPTA